MKREQMIKKAHEYVNAKWCEHKEWENDECLGYRTRIEWSASIEAIATILDMSIDEYMKLIEA